MWKSRCYRYCDADIFLNKIHGCATVHTVGGHKHTNIYIEDLIQRIKSLCHVVMCFL
jgi:hypothetical protein